VTSSSRRYRLQKVDAGEFMPPNLRTLGAMPFGESQAARLSSWLREAGWPREHMDMAELEGYLVALIAWPVGIASGAWLPPIWGVRGWKAPNKISSQQKFDEFVALIVGFMRALDRELSCPASTFESSVLRTLQGREKIAGLHRWGRGFMTALTLDAQGLKWRSAGAGAAVRLIAATTSSSAPHRSRAVEDIVSAVLALMAQRVSRGPLGPLDMPMPRNAHTPASESRAVSAARSRN
jgi:yecA family protein